MKIEVSDDTFDELVYERLREAYYNIQGEQNIAVFSLDPDVEERKLKCLRKSLRHAANWFARPDQKIEKGE